MHGTAGDFLIAVRRTPDRREKTTRDEFLFTSLRHSEMYIPATMHISQHFVALSMENALGERSYAPTAIPRLSGRSARSSRVAGSRAIRRNLPRGFLAEPNLRFHVEMWRAISANFPFISATAWLNFVLYTLSHCLRNYMLQQSQQCWTYILAFFRGFIKLYAK